MSGFRAKGKLAYIAWALERETGNYRPLKSDCATSDEAKAVCGAAR